MVMEMMLIPSTRRCPRSEARRPTSRPAPPGPRAIAGGAVTYMPYAGHAGATSRLPTIPHFTRAVLGLDAANSIAADAA